MESIHHLRYLYCTLSLKNIKIIIILPDNFFKCCCVCVSLSEIHEPNRDRGIGFPAVLSLLVLIGLIHILLPGKLLGNVLGDLPDELAGELEGWLVGCWTS